MQNEIYKITLINLSKVSGLAGFYEHKTAFEELNEYLKSDVAENRQVQNTQNIKFVVHVANGVLANADNQITFQSMQYFINLFIDKHYDYSAEYNWQELKPLLLLVNYLKSASDFKSFGKLILNPHLHILLLKYLNKGKEE